MVKVAVVGLGNMGRNHFRAYSEIEHVRLVGVADRDEALCRKAVRGYQVGIYTDYRQMLDVERPDLVSVVVPTELHASVACEVLSRGIHTLVEKPLAPTREEGEQIIAAATKNKAKLMVGYVERFNPAVREVRRLLNDQLLGRLFQIHAQRLSPFPKRIQDVGVVLDLATHDIDVMRYLVGSETQRVYAEVERKAHDRCEDLLSGLIRFRNGVIGVLDVNWLTPTKVRRLTVLGEGGMYLVDYLTQDVYWYKNDYKTDSWDGLGVFRGAVEGDVVKFNFPKTEPLRAELESFVQAVMEDREPLVSGHDGLMAIEVARQLTESGRTQLPVTC